MNNTEEITDPIISPEQESKEIATIAKASIANIEENKKAYEELASEAVGLTLPELKDPEFKKTAKKVSDLHTKLVSARTAADKLVKQECGKLDDVKVLIKKAGEDLKAITAEAEKEVKTLKETAVQLVADEKAEKERQAEEAKQARIAKLYELGLTHNGSYYSLGDLSITPVQIIQYTDAQFEGFVSQATVEFEAIKLKEAEDKAAEEKRVADKKKAADEQAEANRKAQQALVKENQDKQAALDLAAAKQKEQDDLIANLQAQLKAQEVVKPAEDVKVVATYYGRPKPINGAPILEEVENEYMDDVLAQPDDSAVVDEDKILVVSSTIVFTAAKPFIDTQVGKATLRIYPESFLDDAQDGLTPDMVSATGSISDELLFMVIKPR